MDLSLEMDLLDKLVAHIGINIALRKEQRDRKFIQRVEVFGILFALAAIIIGSSGDFSIKTIAQAKHNPIGDFLSVYLSIPDAWLDVGISITVSLLVPIILGLIWSLTRLVSHVGRVRFFCAAKKRNPTKALILPKEMSTNVIALRWISKVDRQLLPNQHDYIIFFLIKDM
jgi:hypothetical protein